MSYKGYTIERVSMGDHAKDDSIIIVGGLSLAKPRKAIRSVYDAMALIDEDIRMIQEMDQWHGEYLEEWL